MDRVDPPPTPALDETFHQSEERFRLLVESIRDYAIFMLDTTGHILTWNAGAENLKGYTRGEILGKHFSVFYPPEIDRGFPDLELKIATREGRFEGEGWRVRKDGSLFWANVVITALRDADHRLVGFAKVTRDLTERREQQEQLRESEERFRLLVESVRDYAIFMLDPEGRVVSWNNGAERIKGYKASEIIGHHFSRFYTHADIEEARPERQLRDTIRHGSTETEGWRLRKDGSRFWANVVMTALYDSRGQHRGFAKVTRDMTIRRQIEELEESSRRVNEFLAMLAHELRNPLAPIRNAVSVMQRAGALDETATWARDVIDRQTTYLTRLVDDLLDISRIASGKITLRTQPVDLNEIIARAVEAARPLTDAKRHKLTVTPAPGPLLVSGDPTRLAQIAVNLLNNAAKYTPERGSIRVSVRREGDDALLSVEDNGLGISTALLPKIFDLFAQGDRSLARSEGGLGIGLTLARRLVDLHGGVIEAKSGGPNTGSEFIVKLPVLVTAASRPASQNDQTNDRATICRVLVVDDNEDSAQTMGMLLQVAGHHAKLAYDGPSAVALAAEFKPHVVLLDIALPEMNGYEVARRLRAIPDLGNAVLVAMTGYGQEDDRRRAAEAGFAHHMVKPIDPVALERVIASAACGD